MLAIAAALVTVPAATATQVPPAATQAATPHTIVSLEFDDSWSNATIALPLLQASGIHATFFINSGFLGRANRITLADAHALVDAGNEIAGHTVDHPHLTTLSTADQMHEICDDRDALLADGFAVTDFAYPYGESSTATAAIVAQCGYNSGRRVSGIACNGCPSGESIPPLDVYRTRTATGVMETSTLDVLQGYVTHAEQSSGGWVQIVFHQICNGCGIYGVSQDELAQFMAWLAPRSALGTATETVNQVIGGPVRPAVSPPALAADANLAPDAGMELDGDGNGAPDCWSLTGFGANTPTWARTSDAHTGSFAEQLTIANWTSGDRKAIQPLDQGPCAPGVTPGHTYQSGEWFKSSAPVRFVAYIRNASGAWTFWDKSAFAPAAAGWTLATWSPPSIPAGTTAISIGLSLASNGTATFDDLDLRQNLAPNPGFEVDTDANGTPDCWSLTGFGANTPTWTRTSDAHAGSFAEQLTVANWTSGDRKAIQPLDQSTCAPIVTPGHTYEAGEWFKSSAPVRFVAYIRNASGAWTFWDKSAFSPAAAGWTYATWSPPSVPAGTTAVSIGLSLASNGTASFDDFQLIGIG